MTATALVDGAFALIFTLHISPACRMPGSPGESQEKEVWCQRLTAVDRRALTSLIRGHVNLYGRYELDMTTRLALTA